MCVGAPTFDGGRPLTSPFRPWFVSDRYVLRCGGAHHRRHPDRHGAPRHARRAAAVESGHSVSGARLRSRPGGIRADGAGPAGLLRRSRKNGGSRAADLPVRRRAQDRHSPARQTLVPAPSARVSVDGVDRGSSSRPVVRSCSDCRSVRRCCWARFWRRPTPCSPPTCRSKIRRIAIACASASPRRAVSTTAPPFPS